MNNWIVNVEHMLLVNVAKMKVSKIRFDHEHGACFVYWCEGNFEGWHECVPEITDEYLRQAAIEAERVLLEESSNRLE